MKIKTILVDDEKGNIQALQSLLGYLPEVEIMATFENPEEAIPQIAELKPALLFLDIVMPQMDGFELLERLPEKPPAVIFVTAANDKAIKAFKVEAVDYLLKPVLFSELKEAVAKATKKIQTARHALNEMLSFTTQEGIELVRATDIIRLQGDGSYTHIFTQNKKPILVSKNLGELEETLITRGFVRVHTSHLINPSHILRFVKEDGGSLQMSDQAEVPVSRRRKEEILEWLKRLV